VASSSDAMSDGGPSMVTIPTLLSAPSEQIFIVAGFGLASLVVQKFFRLLIDRQRQVHERLIEKHRQKAAEALGGAWSSSHPKLRWLRQYQPQHLA
jgi:hypothetical protein